MKRFNSKHVTTGKRLVVFFFIIHCFYCASLFAQPTSGLVAWYPFNGNANDSSGNGYDGIESNILPIADRFGKLNSAYSFNGTSSSIAIADFHPTVNSFSISVWIKMAQLYSSAAGYIVCDADQFKGTMIYAQNDSIFFEQQKASTSSGYHVGFKQQTSDTNQWIHIVGTCFEGSMKIYRNSILMDSKNFETGDEGIIQFGIGAWLSLNANHFNGYIDDIRIYDRALFTDEINELYHENGWKTFTDIDGNTYNTVKIGNQVWMKENLNTAHYQNGDLIQNFTNDGDWTALTSSGRCYYANDSNTYANTYGALYNWYTVADSRNVCPFGWHVPTDVEWTTLTSFLGGESEAGGKLKESGTGHWLSPNYNATNSSGFTALPGGYRYPTANYGNIGVYCSFYSSTQYNANYAWSRFLSRENAVAERKADSHKQYGVSIRCLKNNPDTVRNLITTAENRQITLKWNKNTETDFAKYYIYGGTSANPTTKIDSTTSISDTSKTITSLINGTTYYYRVTALDNAGLESGYSNEVNNVPVGLVAYYPFNGNANDESGNGNNGTNNGALLVSDRGGEINSAFNFDGNGYIQVNTPPFKIRSFTFFAWIKDESLVNNSRRIFGNDHWGGGDGAVAILIRENKFQVLVQGSSSSFYYETQESITNSWTQVAATYDELSNTIKLYIDGSYKSGNIYSGTTPVLPNQSPLLNYCVGRTGNGSLPDYFIGLIDDIHVYNRALSPNEIDSLYHLNGWPAPDTVRNLTATPGEKQISLKWNKNTEADFLRYRIYGGTAPNPTTQVDSTAGGNIADTLKTISNLNNGTTYYYRVTAVDSSGLESVYSSEIIVKPVFPLSKVRIAYIKSIEGISQICHINADGTGFEQLTHFETNDAGLAYPSYSRDGSKIAFWHNDGSGNNVWIINADGTGLTQITSNNEAYTGERIEFSITSDTIYYRRTVGAGDASYYQCRIDGSENMLLNDFSGNEIPLILVNNSYFMYTIFGGNIYKTVSKTDFSSSLVIGGGQICQYNTLKQKIVYQDYGTSDGKLEIANPDGTIQQDLVDEGSIWTYCASFSHDGNYVVYNTGGSDIKIVGYDGSGKTTITTGYYPMCCPVLANFPDTVRKLTATPGNRQINLKWSQNTETDFLRYRIYGGTAPNPTTQIDSTAGGNIADTLRTYTGLNNGTPYYYRVTAVDSAGLESEYSNEVIASPEGLVAWYPFNGNANDSSGNAFNGVNYSATSTIDRFGNTGRAYKFDGSNYIAVSSPNSILFSKGVTISAWINPSDISGGVILSANDWGNPFIIKRQNAYLAYNSGNQINYSIPNNKWTHLVVTFDQTSFKVYLDNTLFTSQDNTNTLQPVSGNICLGGTYYDYPTASEFYRGIIDDIRIYNRALTASEVNELYHEDGWGPKIILVTPTRNKNNVSKSTTISITFDSSIDLNSVNSNTLKITGSQSGLHAYAKNFNTSTKTLSLTLTKPFNSGEIVTVVATRALSGLFGDSISNEARVWQFTAASANASGSFINKYSYSCGPNGASDIVAIDIEQDGNTDLVVANPTSHDIKVFKNMGNGQFESFKSVNSGQNPGELVASDFNNDGLMDIATSNGWYSYNFSVYLNNNNSSFSLKGSVSTGGDNQSITTGDYDGNGTADIAINNTGGNILIFSNDGAANFTLKQTCSTTGGISYGAKTCDIDKDGDLDIIFTFCNPTITNLLLNDGKGNFSLNNSVTFGGNTGTTTIADLNGDEYPDLAYVPNIQNDLALLLNNQAGGFSPSWAGISGISNPQFGISAVDFDGDSDMDITSVLTSPLNKVIIMKNNASASFSITQNINIGSDPTYITTADLNNDNKIDIAVVNATNSAISILINDIPDTVRNLVATAGNRQITLKWNQNTESDFLRYRIYGGTAPNPTTQIDSAAGGNKADTSKTITNLNNGTTYYYRVTAVDSAGLESEYSNEVIASPEGLVAWYPFTNGNAADSSGNAVHGSTYGTTSINDRFGNANSAFSFDGIDDYINIDNSPIICPRNKLTLSAWFNIQESKFAAILSKRFAEWSSPYNSYIFNLDHDTLYFAISDSVDGSQTSVTAVVDSNKWTHAVGIFDGDSIYLYINGILINKKKYDYQYIGYSDLSLRIGVPIITTQVFNGFIDDIRIFNAALSTNQIDSLYLLGGWPAPDSVRNLTATPGNQQITLKWNQNTEPDFLRYRIYGGTSPNPTTKIDSTINGISDTSIVISELSRGTTYYFRVTAIDSVGLESEYSDEVTGIPFGEICVSTNGNDANPGTPGLPLRNIQTALDMAVGNDTIKVASGNYSQYLTTKCKVFLFGGYNNFFNNSTRDIYSNKTILENSSSMILLDQNASVVDGFVFIGNSSISDAVAKVYNGSVFSHNVIYWTSSASYPAIDIYGGAIVKNNIVYGSTFGIEINSGTGTPEVKNNIVTNNSWGIRTLAYSEAVRTYNCVYGNSFNYSGSYSNPGTGDISLNPQFKDATNYDFRILNTSPCLDAGDPSDDASNEPAGYNSRIDMGAYGSTLYSPYLPALPASPVLALPANGTTNRPVVLTLRWNQTEETETYELQLSDIDDFSNLIANQANITDTFLEVTSLSASTTYYWRVRGVNISGQGNWSTVSNFTTKELPGLICVSTTGDDANPGTPGLPLRNIQTALDMAVANDSIKVASGTYNQYLTTKCKVYLLGGYNNSFNNSTRDIYSNKTMLENSSSMILQDQNASVVDGFIFIGNSNISNAVAKVYNGTILSHNIFYWTSSASYPAIDINGGAIVKNNSIYGGTFGIEINSGTGTPEVKNNIVTNNSWGIRTLAYSETVRTHNCVYSNSFNYDGSYENPGTGDISVSPQYKDAANYDFRILNTSPCLDAGDPSDDASNEPAGYNSRIDMGAYGGTLYSPYLPALPASPLLALPASGTTNSPVVLTLKWSQPEETETYELQLSDIDDFSNLIANQANITDTFLEVTSLSASTTYYWRVRGVNISGQGNWSSVFNFATKELPGLICVSTTGNDANPGTPGLPLRNIQTALDFAVTNDTVKVSSGTYSQYLTTKCKVYLLGGYNNSFNNSTRDIYSNKTILENSSSMILQDQNASVVDGFIFIGNSSISNAVAKVYNGTILSHNVFYWTSSASYPAIDINGGAIVKNNSIYGGTFGIEINSGTGTPDVKNNIITNAGWGIMTYGYSEAVRTHNCVYSNSFNYDGSYANPGTGDISVSPQYKDAANYDFRILYTSPCVNAGDPSDDASNEPVGYNSRIDMGAYGGTAYSPFLKTTLTVTVESKTKTYGQDNPELTMTFSGFNGPDDISVIDNLPVISTSVDNYSNAGTYAGAITISGGSDDNYDFAFVPGDFIVTKATLTATAEYKTKEYGYSNPELTISYSGFVNSENESILDAVPSVSTIANQWSVAGDYEITIGGGSDENYDFSYNTGTLTIVNNPPAEPIGLVSTSGDRQITIRWAQSNNPDFAFYKLFYGGSPNPSSPFDSTEAGNKADTFMIITGLVNGDTYYFRVTTVDSTGNESGYSDEISTSPVEPNVVPNAPTSLVAIAGEKQIALNWQANTESDFWKYRIYMGTTENPSAIIDSVIGKENINKTIYGLATGIKYYFRITAVNSAGLESVYSNCDSATTTTTAITVTDINGNIYNTIKIGNQLWMKENLASTKYDDGSSILKVSDNSVWADLGDNNIDKAYCWVNDDSATNAGKYGAMYTWAAAMNNASSSNANPSGVQGVCPNRWHLPSDAEWAELDDFIINDGHPGTEGTALKDSIGWDSGYNGTNDYGFSAWPGGNRNHSNGLFDGTGSYADWWSSNEDGSDNAFFHDLGPAYTYVYRGSDYKSYGFSIRCLKNNPDTVRNLSATPGNRQITLKWNQNTEPDFLRYRIYGGTSPNPTTQIDSTESGNAADILTNITELINGSTYYFRITAVDNAGLESEFSNSANATPQSGDPCTNDTIKPIAFCKDIYLTIYTDPVSIDPIDLDNGSSDNCGIMNYSASQTSFITAGKYPVTLTTYDYSSNQMSCNSNIFVTQDNTSPSAPTGLATMAGDAQITLKWKQNTEPDFLRYRIYGGNSPNPTTQIDSTETSNTADTLTIITGLINGSTYYLRITAVDNAGLESGYSNSANSTPQSGDPCTNDTIKPIAFCKDIYLTIYTDPVSIDPIDLDNGSSDNCGIMNYSASQTSFITAGKYPVTLTTYDYSSNQISCNSNIFVTQDNTSPSAPTGLATMAGDAQITLKWKQNTESDFLRYRVYRGTSPNPTIQIDSTESGNAADTLTIITGLINGTTYYFRITALDNAGLESGYSNEVSEMFIDAVPVAPTGLKINTYPDSAVLTWTKNTESDINGYVIYRSLENDTTIADSVGCVAHPSTGSGCRFKLTTNYQQNYFYWIKAKDNINQKSWFTDYSSLIKDNKIDGLIAYFPFSGNFDDLTGNSSLVAQSSVTYTTDFLGRANNAITFSGGYLNFSNSLLPLDSSARTIDCWVKISNMNSGMFVQQGYGCTGKSFGIKSIMPSLGFYGGCNDINFTTIPNNTWVNVAVTYDKRNITLYLGNQKQVTSMPNLNTQFGNLLIGACATSATGGPYDNYLYGSIDEVRMYNRALSDAEIYSLQDTNNYKNNSQVVNIGITSVGVGKTKIVQIYNSSTTDTIHISQTKHSYSSFVISHSSFDILPGQTYNDTITFKPTLTGEFADTLLLFGNSSVIKIAIKGTGVTNICAPILTNTTWTKANSPYFINCSSFTVFTGVTLTIEPGVTVILDTAKQLSILGNLVANGTKKDSIIFTSTSIGKFNQVYMRDGSTAMLSYVKIENATKGIYGVASSTSTLTMKNCRVLRCGTNIEWRGKSISIDSSEIAYSTGHGLFFGNNCEVSINHSKIHHNAARGINHENPTSFIVENSRIYNNSDYGIYLSDMMINSIRKRINNCYISSNSIGIFGRYIIAENDTFTGNTSYGAYLYQSLLRNSVVNNNGSHGIYGYNDTIQNNLITGNTQSGIYIYSSHIWSNTITNNKQHGIFNDREINNIKYNTISENTLDGINTAYNDTIKYNSIKNNSGDGIETSALPNLVYNNICGNTGYNIRTTRTTGMQLAENNYFCTSDSTSIANKIYDIYDNSNLIIVDYVPFLTDSFAFIVPPTNIIATTSTLNSISLSWLDNSNNETGFELQRSETSGSGFVAITNLGAGSTTFIDESLSENTTYYYKIRAVKNSSYSEFSSVLQANTQALFEEQTGIALTGVSNSSVAWGDYDNDDDLDIILTGGGISSIYQNIGNNNFVQKTNIDLIRTSESSVSWSDYDNDEDLDLLISGLSDTGRITKIYKNYGNDSFFEVDEPELVAVNNGSVDWGDFDNDGKKDILLTGNASSNQITKIYKNTGNDSFAEQNEIILPGVDVSSAKWADYDKDGNLDILLAGHPNSGNDITKIYRYSDNFYVEQTQIGLTGITHGNVCWGDYDNDGDLDILINGNNLTKIYENKGNNTFIEKTNIALTGVTYSFAAWGDFDNDGDLDILLTGFWTGYLSNELISKIYENNGNGSFSEITNVSLTGVYNSAIAWGDYDNDGDLDILLTGYPGAGMISKIYLNNNNIKNIPPQVPTSLSTSVKGTQATLQWQAPTDDHTPSQTLAYNVFLRSETDTIVMPHTNLQTGFLKTPDLGNAQLDTFFIIKGLAPGKYYWSVQAIDQAFKGGLFAAKDSFSLAGVTVAGAAGSSAISTDNGTLLMAASVTPADLPNNTVTWRISSNDKDTASISTSGLLTARRNGRVIVRATLADGSGIFGEKEITITNQIVSVDSIKVNGTGGIKLISSLPGSLQMVATVYPADAANKSITWSVQTGAASGSINTSGLLSAIANGTITIRATSNDGSNVYGETQVVVDNSIIPVSSITVTSTGGVSTINLSNPTLQMLVTILPSTATNKEVTWSINNTAIASISTTGLLTAKAAGSVTVTAAAKDGSDVEGSKIITINNNSSEVAPPKNLNATPGDGFIVLNWDKNTEPYLNHYKVYVRTESNFAVLKDNIIQNETVLNGLTNGKTYNFVVTAVDNDLNESNYSNEVSATPVVDTTINGVKPQIADISNICPGDETTLVVANADSTSEYYWFEDGIQINSKPMNKIKIKVYERSYTVKNVVSNKTSVPATITWKPKPPKPEIYQGGGPNVYYFATDAKASDMTYRWYLNDIEISGGTKYYYIAGKKEGVYYVRVGQPYKTCFSFSKKDTLVIPKNQKSGEAGINEISVYPNPAGDEINITINNFILGSYVLQISDLAGRPVMRTRVEKKEPVVTTTLQINNLASGNYIIDLQTNMDINKRRIFIKN